MVGFCCFVCLFLIEKRDLGTSKMNSPKKKFFFVCLGILIFQMLKS